LDEPSDLVAPIRPCAHVVAAPLVVLASDGAAAHAFHFCHFCGSYEEKTIDYKAKRGPPLESFETLSSRATQSTPARRGPAIHFDEHFGPVASIGKRAKLLATTHADPADRKALVTPSTRGTSGRTEQHQQHEEGRNAARRASRVVLAKKLAAAPIAAVLRPRIRVWQQ
jgi:hypothetical protein